MMKLGPYHFGKYKAISESKSRNTQSIHNRHYIELLTMKFDLNSSRDTISNPKTSLLVTNRKYDYVKI